MPGLEDVKNRWEGEPVDIEARLTGTFAAAQKVSFVYQRLQSEEKFVDEQPVSGGSVKSTWTPPILDKTQNKHWHYYKWHLEIDGKAVCNPEVLKVWARRIIIEAVDFKKKKPLVGQQVVPDEGAAPGLTSDDKGVIVYEMPGFVEPSFTWAPPAELYCWAEGAHDTGRYRKAELEVKGTAAKIVSPRPKKAGEPVTVYVNLDPSKIKVKVKGEPNGQLHVRALFADTNSKRNEPKPELIAAGATVEQNVHKATLTADASGEATFEVELGLAGKDSVTIGVGATSAAADDSITVVNLRRVWYQPIYRAGMTPPDFAEVEAAFVPAGIELVRSKEALVDEVSDGTQNWIDGGWYSAKGKGQRWWNVGQQNFPKVKERYFRDERHPRELSLMLCDTTLNFAKDATGDVVTTVAWEIDEDDRDDDELVTTGSWKGGAPAKITKRAFGFAFAFPKRLDGSDAFVDVTWTCGSKSGTLGPDDLWWHPDDWEEASGYSAIRVRIPQACWKEKATMKFSGTLYYFEEVGGMTKGYHTANGVGGRDAKTLHMIVVHEIGHVLGQAFTGTLPGVEPHGRAYTGKNHQGPHCADGVKLDDAQFASAQTMSQRTDCTCFMYGEIAVASCAMSFCARCLRHLRAVDLRDVTKLNA
jgi:hypothetical protein